MAAFLAALLLASQVAAEVIRGDYDWVSSAECPEGWASLSFDDSAWAPVAFPWVLLWPSPFELDPEALPFWEAKGTGVACTRRAFELAEIPHEPAQARVLVDDDYELWLNGRKVGESKDEGFQRPGETYDVTPLLQVGRNLIGLKLIDTAYEKGAFFSLDLPGIPVAPRSLKAWLRILAPWAQFAVLLAAAALFCLMLRAALNRLRPRLASWPAGVAALLTLALAVGCQYVLQTSDLYVAPMEQPWADWDWRSVSLAAVLFLGLFCLRHADGDSDESGPVRGELVCLGGIVVLAAFLRIYDIDTIPVGFYQDEATNGNDAIALWEIDEAPYVTVWSDSVGGRPTLFLYLLGLCLKVFGDSYLSLKVLPIAVSLASVVAVYAVGRIAFGPRAGLWSALFFAVSRSSIHYARMAWEVNCVPLFSAAGFALLLAGVKAGGLPARAVRDEKGDRYLIAGASVLALGLYTYAAYRAVPVAAVVFLGLTWLSRGGEALRAQRVSLIRAGLAAGIVALPLVGFALTASNRFWERYNDVSLTYYMGYYGTPMPWLHQIGKGFLSLNNLGDDLIRHNLSGASHLDAITGAFFLLGLATAARANQQLGLRLLWAWLLVFLALASLTRDAPHATRYLGLIPPAVIFAGFGAARLFARLRRALRLAPLAWTFASATAAAVAAVNAYQYFVVEAHHPNSDFEMNVTARVVCERIRKYDDVEVFWTSDIAYWAGGPCQYLARGRGHYIDVTPEMLSEGHLAKRVKGPSLFFIGPEHVNPERGVVPFDGDGLPILGLPGHPAIQRDRQARLMHYVWEFPSGKPLPQGEAR